MRLDLLANDFTYRAVTQHYLVVYEPDFLRGFVHVHDIGRAFLHAIDHADQMTGQIYNVGDDTLNFSKRQLCELIKERVGECYIHYAEIGQDPDKQDCFMSYAKINGLGFATTVSMGDGIDELIRGFAAITFKNPYTNDRALS